MRFLCVELLETEKCPEILLLKFHLLLLGPPNLISDLLYIILLCTAAAAGAKYEDFWQ